MDKYISGIASYIETIDQNIMVLFDEFDKTFGDVKVPDGKSRHRQRSWDCSMG